MFDVRTPVAMTELRIKDRFLKRDFKGLFESFFHAGEASSRKAVLVVSHSGTISNMLYSHTGKDEEEVLKPRNASVIAVDDSGRLGLRHEGTLAECKYDEWHEYFTVPQFEQFAEGVQFGYAPPPSCLLLLVRHGIALNNVNKAYTDGSLTPEGVTSVVKAALRISHVLQQHGIRTVDIFSSACVRTRHSSELLQDVLGRRLLPSSHSLPCLAISCGAETETEETWLQGAVPVGV